MGGERGGSEEEQDGGVPEPSAPFAFQLRVVLRGVSPLIWRRILVRSDSTVADRQAPHSRPFSGGALPPGELRVPARSLRPRRPRGDKGRMNRGADWVLEADTADAFDRVNLLRAGMPGDVGLRYGSAH